MITFSDFLAVEGTPIYLQIMRYIKQGLVAGTIRAGDEMPSRRALSALLTVNPNTIQKAYRLLEEEGLVESRSGAMSTVCASAEQVEHVRRELVEGEMRRMAAAARAMGLTKEEAHALLDRLYDEEETL
ncbi:MAG: GntR family transcriptional regulator [Oscillospiraceae bacterium]|nr:GntR family transcriptional regulator [Oscillospiraceae bacterium]